MLTASARWITIGALFLIPFLPLYVSNSLFFPFISGKGFAFRILVEVALVGYLVLALLDKRYRPKFSFVFVSVALFTAWMAVANAFAVLPGKAFWSNFERMDGWVTLAHVCALFVVAGSVLTVERLWRRWWLFFVSVAAAVCAYGTIQLLGGAEIHQGGVRVDATFGNAIYLGVYLMFTALVAAWLSIDARGWTRNALLILAGVATIILFYTASRGAVLGLAAGVVGAAGTWLALTHGERKSGVRSRGLKIAGGALLALMLLGGAFFLARDTAFVQNEPALARLSTIFSLGEELKVRTTLWGMALEGVKEDPITGWGQEGFNYVFNKYYDPSLYSQEAWFDRAHNTYIDWLVAGGVPALLLFLALLLAALVAIVRTQDLSRSERALFVGVLIAYGTQALVAFDNLFSYIPLAMVLAMAHAHSARSVTRLEQLPEVRSETAQTAIAIGAGVCAVALVWMVNVPSIRAGHHLVYAISPLPNAAMNLEHFKVALAEDSFVTQEAREQLVSYAVDIAKKEQVPDDLRSEFVALAVTEMSKGVEYAPRDARLRMQLAGALELAGDLEGALRETEMAITYSPRKQLLHIMRGYRLWNLDRVEEAREAFLTAYTLDTSFDDLAVTAASGLIVTGDIVGGKALLTEAVGTTTVAHNSLFYAYYQTKQWNDLVAVARAQVDAQKGAPESRYRLAQALAAAQRFSEARAEVAATMSAHPETSAKGQALLAQIPAL